MGLRILTGILRPVPGHQTGVGHSATITFNPHGVSGDAVGAELSEMGDAGDFNAPPGKIVSLRRIMVTEWEGFPPGELDLFFIDDDAPTTHEMVVSWGTQGLPPGPSLSSVFEISYMIVGEA